MAKASKEKQLALARKEIQQFMKVSGATPEFLAQVGEMANACLKDKTLYPMLRQQLMASGFFEEDDLTPRYNPSQLAVFYTVGKMAREMMQPQQAGA